MHVHPKGHLLLIYRRIISLVLQKSSRDFIQLSLRKRKVRAQKIPVDDFGDRVEATIYVIKKNGGPGLAVGWDSDSSVEVRLVDVTLEGDVFGVCEELHLSEIVPLGV